MVPDFRIIEVAGSRKASISQKDGSAEIRFRGRDRNKVATDTQARAALLSVSPAIFAGMFRHGITVTEPGPYQWEGTVTYSPTARPEQGTPEAANLPTYELEFDTAGGQETITQSLATENYTASGFMTAPDYKGAIGVKEGRVEGVQVPVSLLTFSETHYLPNSVVTPAYVKLLADNTWRVFDKPFRSFESLEVLFAGASGKRKGSDGMWSITFRFQASANRTNFEVGDITVLSKKGWSYLEVHHKDVEDAAAQKIVQQPVAVYIHKIYEYCDPAILGIGVE